MNFFSNLLHQQETFPPAHHKSQPGSSPSATTSPSSSASATSSSSSAVPPVDNRRTSSGVRPTADKTGLGSSTPEGEVKAETHQADALLVQVNALKKERSALEARCTALAEEHRKDKQYYEASLEGRAQVM